MISGTLELFKGRTRFFVRQLFIAHLRRSLAIGQSHSLAVDFYHRRTHGGHSWIWHRRWRRRALCPSSILVCYVRNCFDVDWDDHQERPLEIVASGLSIFNKV